MVRMCGILLVMPESLTAFFISHTAFMQAALPYVAMTSLLVALIALAIVIRFHTRLTRLTLGRNGSLEESLAILSRDMKEIQIFRKELEQYLKTIEKRVQSSIQGVGVIRFNPFFGDGSGGNQSFSIAFLDEMLSGVVFSTLHARDRVAVYAKPIEKGISSFELTDEERAAIDKAQQSVIGHKQKRANI